MIRLTAVFFPTFVAWSFMLQSKQINVNAQVMLHDLISHMQHLICESEQVGKNPKSQGDLRYLEPPWDFAEAR